MQSYSLHAPAEELDVTLCVTSGQVFRWEVLSPNEWRGVDGDHWYHVVRQGDTLQVRSNVHAEHFRSLFSLDEDRKWRDEVSAASPEVAPYLEAMHGLRVMRPTSAHETLFCFICTANNHLSRITQMVRKLAAYGDQMDENDAGSFTRFPSLQRIAAIPEEEFRQAGFGYRGKTIPVVANQLLDKPVDWLESLRLEPYAIAQQELLSLYGVGRKLADCIALYGLQKSESVPIDTHLWQALTRLYFPEWKEKPLTDSRYREASEFMRQRFGAHAGAVHQVLYYENLINRRTR